MARPALLQPRLITGLVLGFGLAAGLLFVVLQEESPTPPTQPPPTPGVSGLRLQPASFDDLPGWKTDRIEDALGPFLRSCARTQKLKADQPVGGSPVMGQAGQWQPLCTEAARIGNDAAVVRAFFEQSFVPVAAFDGAEPQGLFTGYYEATLTGSLEAKGPFATAILARPPDLITVDLGRFGEEFRGRRIAGKVNGGDLVPYETRAEIEAGALKTRTNVIAYVDDPVEAFFLHIQGSGRITLPDGRVIRAGYAATNGRPYTAIGKVLIEKGALTSETVSMQTIRAWLAANPAEAAAVMNTNTSYVFFRELPVADPSLGPEGADGQALTPGRSLAVDRKFHALGVPMFLSATVPAPKEGDADVAFARLLVAQDTGGAIRGPVRGDVFWGAGKEAESIAGRMKHPGRLWLLLPKEVAKAISPAS